MNKVEYFLQCIAEKCTKTINGYKLLNTYINRNAIIRILSTRFGLNSKFVGDILLISPKSNGEISFILTKREHKILQLATDLHDGQYRKKTKLPYITHPKEVAFRAFCIAPLVNEVIEIGLLHDVMEDCDVTKNRLIYELYKIGYNDTQINSILESVIDLTSIYTSSNYPHFNRAKRKRLEAERLWNVGYKAQIVKLGDIDHNTDDIINFDKKYAQTYIQEKLTTIDGFNIHHWFIPILKTKLEYNLDIVTS